MLIKTVWRSIKGSLGRYIAILAIIMLGVGFFAGLRVTKDAMLRTASDYIDELELYDLRLLSTLGLTEEDVEAFDALDGVKAYGGVSADVILLNGKGSDVVFHSHLLQSDINKPDLRSGRMPEKGDECLLDARISDLYKLGDRLELSDANPQKTRDGFAFDAYTIVGFADSPEYINFERGTTALAGGSVSGFMYLPRDGMVFDCYTEIYIDIPAEGGVYSAEYEDAVDARHDEIAALLEERANGRYEALRGEIKARLDEAESGVQMLIYGGYPEQSAEVSELKAACAELESAYDDLRPASVYTLDRRSNIGYASLENDTSIVSGIAKVFPLFFFLVAALVCITTMTRMVSETRTENGVMKALGFGSGAVAGRYMLYSGSAALFGSAVGFIVGSRLMPLALWHVYSILYTIRRPIEYVFDVGLFVTCLVLYMICSLGSTWLVCRRELNESAAQLIRPKAPAAGKRVILERVGFLWKRIKFLHKVSIRNILRYKKRMIMMAAGVGGCTALLLTGFGIRDSIQPVVGFQYDEISLYDAAVSFSEPVDKAAEDVFCADPGIERDNVLFLYSGNADIIVDNASSAVRLAVFESSPDGFVDLHDGDEKVAFPAVGEAVINCRFASDNGINIGDTVSLDLGESGSTEVKISGIFDNYIYDYAYISAETYKSAFGKEPPVNTAYVDFSVGDGPHEMSARLLGISGVSGVTLSEDMVLRVGNMLESLDYVVLIVLVCAGALAIIVLYDLANITVIERTREIATLKVLGFQLGEQNSYVFRENIVLTALGALCGIPMGIALLHYVMDKIRISTIYLPPRLDAESYVTAIALTFVFAAVVDILMVRKIKSIDMAQAMKAIE